MTTIEQLVANTTQAISATAGTLSANPLAFGIAFVAVVCAIACLGGTFSTIIFGTRKQTIHWD